VANTDKLKNILIYLAVINNADLFIILLFIGQIKQRFLKIAQKYSLKIKSKTNRNNKNKKY